MSVQLQLRGIGPPVIQRYLIDLGADETDAGILVGDGWTATVEASDPIPIGALRIGLTVVTFAGDDAVIQRIVAGLKAKVLRAGG